MSVRLTSLIVLAVLIAALCLWAGAHVGRGGVISADVQAHAARADAAERRAQLAAQSAADAHRHADALRLERRALAADTARLGEDLRRARAAARVVADQADRDRTRFEETGSLDDCSAALASCSAARAVLAEVVAEQDTLLVVQAEMLLIASAETMQLRSAYDSVAVALGHSFDALDEQRAATGAAVDLASRHRRERNIALGAGGALLLAFLLTR